MRINNKQIKCGGAPRASQPITVGIVISRFIRNDNAESFSLIIFEQTMRLYYLAARVPARRDRRTLNLSNTFQDYHTSYNRSQIDTKPVLGTREFAPTPG